MPTSPDSILALSFDPSIAAVLITVDGSRWPAPVSALTVSRQVAGQASEPMRGWDTPRTAGGGWLTTADHEMRHDVTVTYTVTGYAASGAMVRAVSVPVETTGAAWGLWMKAAGRPGLTVRAGWMEVGERVTAPQGGVYQIIGGAAVSQSAGETAETLSITIGLDGPTQVAAVRTLLREAAGRTLLLTTGEPAEIEHGWYAVGQASLANPAQLRSDHFARRDMTLTLTRASAPAGAGSDFGGVTYQQVAWTHPTYADTARAGTYADLARGA